MLRCRDGSLYTGITNDLPKRLTRHDAGTASAYTRARRPVRLVFQERQPDRSAALRRGGAGGPAVIPRQSRAGRGGGGGHKKAEKKDGFRVEPCGFGAPAGSRALGPDVLRR